jgi:predicted nucleotide-binding protein
MKNANNLIQQIARARRSWQVESWLALSIVDYRVPRDCVAIKPKTELNMVKKRSDSTQPSLPIELTVNREDAKARLTDRIEKGLEINGQTINSLQALDQAQKEYYKWNDFNKELLKRIFSTDELSIEYSRYLGVGVVMMREPSLGEKIQKLHKDIDGKIHRLDSILERLELIPVMSSVDETKIANEIKIDKSKVFIVHGHDELVKVEVARFIEKLGFEPIILHEQASSSKTVIEKIETYSGVGFGVVLYTPCDLGGKNIDPPKLQGRARQNVVFEHGYLIGKLGRGNVCQLVKGNVETPTDISGIVYVSIDSGNWQIELAKELRGSGYAVDMNKVI